jgi:putative ABC transport system permease protein
MDLRVPRELQPKLALGEILSFAYDNFRQNKVRFALTALGMVIGTASLILVVTIGLTGKQYLLNQIQAIGANQVLAEYEGGATRITAVAPDPLTMDDLRAVREQVPGIVVASPVIPLDERVPVGEGRERDLRVLGVNPEYRQVRNLIVVAGRFFDDQDSTARNKVGLITLILAKQLYGSAEAAVGRTIKISGLPFVIIGVFKEGVETFGQTEVTDNTIVIPFMVSRFFTETGEVKQLYFSVADSSMVVAATEQIRHVIVARHRPESVYTVHNLTQLITLADRTANILTIVLLLIAMVVLLVSGIGIMNIMLATVNSRIREIGVRKAIGATTREIRFQFLSEAVLISLIGGSAGIVIGMAIPFSLRFLFDFHIPISGLSAIIAIVVSTLVGIIFGTVPATRAAQADPVESLRYE